MTAWTPDDLARLVELYRAHGGNTRLIAEAVGRSEPSVRNRVLRLRQAGADVGRSRAPKGKPAPRADHRTPASLAKAAARERLCMCCRKPFPSTGAHHRLCDRCRPSDGLPAQWGHV